MAYVYNNQTQQEWPAFGINSETRLPLLVGLLIAILLHGFVLPSLMRVMLDAKVVVAEASQNESSKQPKKSKSKHKEKRFEKPKKQAHEVPFGRDNATDPNVVAWISYEQLQKLIAKKSDVDQPSLQKEVDSTPQAPMLVEATPLAPKAVIQKSSSSSSQPPLPSQRPQLARRASRPRPARSAGSPVLASKFFPPTPPMPPTPLTPPTSTPPMQQQSRPSQAAASLAETAVEKSELLKKSLPPSVLQEKLISQAKPQIAKTLSFPDGQRKKPSSEAMRQTDDAKKDQLELPPTAYLESRDASSQLVASPIFKIDKKALKKQARKPRKQEGDAVHESKKTELSKDMSVRGHEKIEQEAAASVEKRVATLPEKNLLKPAAKPTEKSLAAQYSKTNLIGQSKSLLKKLKPLSKPVTQQLLSQSSSQAKLQPLVQKLSPFSKPSKPSPAVSPRMQRAYRPQITPSRQTPDLSRRKTLAKPHPTSSTKSDRESDAYRLTDSDLTMRAGGVLVGKGVEIVTVKAHFSVVTLSFIIPRNPKVHLTFNREGRVIDAYFIESTGYMGTDGPLLASLYRWRAKGRIFKKLKRPLEITFTIQFDRE